MPSLTCMGIPGVEKREGEPREPTSMPQAGCSEPVLCEEYSAPVGNHKMPILQSMRRQHFCFPEFRANAAWAPRGPNLTLSCAAVQRSVLVHTHLTCPTNIRGRSWQGTVPAWFESACAFKN